MANSADVSAGDSATAAQYNNLRADALNISTGHVHSGSTDGGKVITSVGTLTTLTVDNVIINGTNIGHTSDTDLMSLASGTLTIAGNLSVTQVTVGEWVATAISAIKGGTNQTTWTTGDVLYSSASNTLAKLPIGSASHVLQVSAGGIPEWTALSSGGATFADIIIYGGGV